MPWDSDHDGDKLNQIALNTESMARSLERLANPLRRVDGSVVDAEPLHHLLNHAHRVGRLDSIEAIRRLASQPTPEQYSSGAALAAWNECLRAVLDRIGATEVLDTEPAIPVAGVATDEDGAAGE